MTSNPFGKSVDGKLPTILDATAGNRMIWTVKKDPRILWIDIEPELEVKPDRVLDCTKTDFPDKHFNFIVFDPPYEYGKKVGTTYFSCRNKAEREAFEDKYNMKHHGVSYYGSDKVKNRTEVMVLCYKSLNEFKRILKDDGFLFFKWNELQIPLSKLLSLMNDWLLMIKLEINDSNQSAGKSQTYWLLFLKNLERIGKQRELS